MGPNILRIMRKWNSSSPLFSHGVSQGGGYFLTTKNHHGETKGIVIDPGYAFFDIFRDIGLGIADIDAIIITHDHDDHTDSVEGILSLLAKYNDHNEKSKVIDIFRLRRHDAEVQRPADGRPIPRGTGRSISNFLSREAT